MMEPGAVVFTALATAAIIGGLVEAGSLIVNKILEDKTPYHPDKYETYECGELTIGDPQRVRYVINFYPYLVAFLVAEVAGILALAISAKPTPSAIVGLALLYFALIVGLVWVRKIGIMKWVR